MDYARQRDRSSTLRIPEAAQIEAIIRSTGGDPNRAPFV